jgi:AraC family transcriptional regulator
MAAAAGYSLYHFSRVFNTATHHTPYSYLIRRRLAEAARALVDTDALVIDVALDYQFNNPETFTRACRRVFGATPSRLRDSGDLDPHDLMPALTARHLDYLVAHRETLRPVFVKRRPLFLAGLMAWIEDDPAPAPCAGLWSRFEAVVARHDALAALTDRYGLRWYPPGWARDGFAYLAAVRLPDASVDLTGAPLVRKTLPGGPYVGFSHAGPPETLGLLLDYVYHTWLPNAERTLAAPFILEYREARGITLCFPLHPA